MSQNPYQTPDPFGATTQPHITGNPLQIRAIILIILSGLWLAYGLFNMVVALSTGPPPAPPNQPPAFAIGQAAGFYGAVFLIPIFSVLTLLGSISMLRLKNYGMAMTGAILGLIPICGPCVIFAIPFAIWALVLLLKPEVKALFS